MENEMAMNDQMSSCPWTEQERHNSEGYRVKSNQKPVRLTKQVNKDEKLINIVMRIKL